MGCESCTSDSCSSGSCSPENKGLPPGILKAYKLSTNRADGYLVWIEIEHNGDEFRVSEASRRVLGKIRSIKDGSRVWGVVFGHIELKPLYHEIYGLGVETLYEVHTKDLVTYHPEAYAACIAQIVVRTEPASVLIGHTRKGIEVAGRVAALLETGVVPCCSDVRANGRDLVFAQCSSDGNVTESRVTTYPQVATLDPGSLTAVERSESEGTVIYWRYDGSGKKKILKGQ